MAMNFSETRSKNFILRPVLMTATYSLIDANDSQKLKEEGELESSYSDASLGLNDEELIEKIPKHAIKRLAGMSEIEREKEILKYIEKYDVQVRREEMKSRINRASLKNSQMLNGNLKNNLKDDFLLNRKSAKWSTEEDLSDIEELSNKPIHNFNKKIFSKSSTPISNAKKVISKIVDHDTNLHESIDDHIFSNSKTNVDLSKTKEISDLSQLNNMRLSRNKIVKALYMPFFEEFVINSFVKINVGTVRDPNIYIVTKVVGIEKCARPYIVDEIKTDKLLKVISASSKGDFDTLKILYVSNSPVNSEDFQIYKKRIGRNPNGLMRLPTVGEMKQKIHQINSAVHYKLSEDEITKCVNEKKKFQSKPHNLAVLKSNIIAELEIATDNNDVERIKTLNSDLEKLEKECDKQIETHNKRYEGMARVNLRNRMINQRIALDTSYERKTQKFVQNTSLMSQIDINYEPSKSSDCESEYEKNLQNNDQQVSNIENSSNNKNVSNPFKRQYCRPNLVYKKSQNNQSITNCISQTCEKPEINDSVDVKVKNNIDITTISNDDTPQQNKILASKTNKHKTHSHLHDFEVNIDLIDI